MLTVVDVRQRLSPRAKAPRQVGAARLLGYLDTALNGLADA